MHIEVSGKGTPVVLLHGFCEDIRIWQRILPALEEEHQVIRVDLPGFGSSPSMTADLARWADTIGNKLESAGISTPWHIIGHSLGGYVALAMAEAFPAAVRSLTLLHSSAFADTEEKKDNRNRNIASVEKYGPVPFVKGLIPGLFAKGYEGPEVSFAMDIAKDQPAEGIISALQAMRDRKDRTEVLKKASFPVHIIFGKNDQLLTMDSQADLSRMAPYTMFSVLTASGHMGMLEEPEKVSELISEFYRLNP